MNAVEPPQFPESPTEFLAFWSASHGNLRHFIEGLALPPLGRDAQLAAGQAAAENAVREAYDMDLDSFHSGVESVSGSIEAAGSLHLSPSNPDVTEEPGVAAFFDVDNTLIRGSSLIALALGLARRRFFSVREVIPMAWKQLKFRITGSENADDMAAGRTQALEIVKGRRVEELAQLCEEIVDHQMEDRAFPGTLSLAQGHLDAGHQVWLVTATPVQLAQVIARRFGFTGALGTVPEVRDGVFTGNLVGDILHGPGKTHAVAALAALEKLDLSRCTAYSDSINDVPMLSMVGTAVAINPDKRLRAEAQRRGWTIRDYRNVRKAIRTYGLPGLATAALSLAGWRLQRSLKR